MLPQTQIRKKKNSSKVNLIISLVFHSLLIGAGLYFAAREGLLGKEIKKLAVERVKEEKPKEKPKEPDKPKIVEPPKELPKEVPKVVEETRPPPPTEQPVVAPPPSDVADFNFTDGAHTVNTEKDPVLLYKGRVEYALRSKWDRPENMDDEKYEAEVQVQVDQAGGLSHMVWLKGSGNAKWDQSVKDVFKVVQSMDTRPPTNFPPQVTIRFDVETLQDTEPVM